MELLLVATLWLLTQWKEILIVFFVFLLIKIFKDNLSAYEKKLADIDYNVKQIAKKTEALGTEEENNSKPVHEQTFRERYREQKRKELDSF